MKRTNSSTLSRRRLLLAAAWATLAIPTIAAAQESEPGDACAGTAAGTVRQSSGPEISGGHLLYCDGASWVSILSYDEDAHLTTLGAEDCDAGEVLSHNGTYWACTAAASLSSLWTAGAGDTIYYNSGTPKVGIGTPSPQKQLSVISAGGLQFHAGPSNFTGFEVNTTDSTFARLVTAYGRGIKSHNNGQDIGIELDAVSDDAFSYSTARLGVTSIKVGATKVISIPQSGGNANFVGIGTTSPDTKLDVAGNVSAEQYCDEDGNNCFEATDVAASSGLWQKGAGDIVYYNSGAPKVGVGLNNPTGMIQAESTVGGTDPLILTDSANGNARFYFTTPLGSGADLNINSGSGRVIFPGHAILSDLVASRTGSTTVDLESAFLAKSADIRLMTRNDNTTVFSGGSHEDTIIKPYDAAKSVIIKADEPAMSVPLLELQDSAGNLLVVVEDTGNVSIGPITPDVALDVDGDIDYTGVIRDVSDARLKSDIESLSADAAAAIGQLKPVSFTMKNGDGWRELGFIAQDVEEVLPELVRTGADGMKSLNYVGLIAPLTAAVQELQQENDDLRRRLDQIEKAFPPSPEE